jgi:hypothetical protein
MKVMTWQPKFSDGQTSGPAIGYSMIPSDVNVGSTVGDALDHHPWIFTLCLLLVLVHASYVANNMIRSRTACRISESVK